MTVGAGSGGRVVCLLATILVPLLSARAAEAQGATSSPAYSVRWLPPGAKQWAVEVAGISAASLNELRRAQWTSVQWQKVLVVRVEQTDLFGDIGAPAMNGDYTVEKDLIRFTPQFPPAPGLKYRASFHPASLPGARSGLVASALYAAPSRSTTPTTVVRQIFPSASTLPENLLKFYVHFSAPMSRGHIYDHIHLRNAEGKDIELPFLEIDEELWDPTMTRLTLFIDPGRIKRGVTPLEEVGPALEQGKRYTLVIDREWVDAAGVPLKATFRKDFVVGPPDREPIVVTTWKIQPPKAGTREALEITFPKPMDHALAQRMIQVSDNANATVIGATQLRNEERAWIFAPTNAWRAGAYALRVHNTIEDLAGNNVGKSFEVDLFDNVQRRFTNETVKIPFEVR